MLIVSIRSRPIERSRDLLHNQVSLHELSAALRIKIPVVKHRLYGNSLLLLTIRGVAVLRTMLLHTITAR